MKRACGITGCVLSLQLALWCSAGGAKKPSFEKIQKLAEMAEAVEAAKPISVSEQQLQKGILEATKQLSDYLASQPDDVEALLLAARLTRAEIMFTPVALSGKSKMAQDLGEAEKSRREKADRAAGYCDRVVALQPNNAAAYYWKERLYGIRNFGWRNDTMAWVYVDLNLAVQAGRKAVELDPRNVLYRETLANYLARNRQRDEAIEVMRDVGAGTHLMYLLLMDAKRIPLPDKAAFLPKETEDTVQSAVEGRWKDYPELRIYQYVLPMTIAEVEEFYRRSWPEFKLFKVGSEKDGEDTFDNFVQLFLWRNNGFVPAAKLEDIPKQPSEGLRLSFTEAHLKKPRTPPFPVPVGDPFCVLTIRDFRPTKAQ